MGGGHHTTPDGAGPQSAGGLTKGHCALYSIGGTQPQLPPPPDKQPLDAMGEMKPWNPPQTPPYPTFQSPSCIMKRQQTDPAVFI